ncbi:MAG: hypothetical protein ACLUKN_06435 [Bacilli bacterium]
MGYGQRQRWDRVQKAYDCLVGVKAEAEVSSAEKLSKLLRQPRPRQYAGRRIIVPTWIVEDGNPSGV